MRVLAFTLAAVLLCSMPAAFAADGCTVSFEGTSGSVVCTGSVPTQTEGGQEWDAALAPFANATGASAQFTRIGFASASFQRMLDIVFAIGSSNLTGGVQVAVTNCSMRGVDAEAAIVATAAGSTQYVVTLTNSVFSFNQVNATGAFASQVNLNVALQLLGTELRGNTLMLAGAAAVGATGTASISLAQGSSVANNKVTVMGALGVGGDASVSVQLSGSNVTGNTLGVMGGIAVGSQGSASATGQNETGVVLARNSVDWQAAIVTEQPLVASVLNGIMALGFKDPSFDLPSALTGIQGQLCGLLANMSWAEVPAQMQADLEPLVDRVSGLLCEGGGDSPAFDMASLAPMITELAADGAEGLASALDGLLGDLLGSPDLLQSLVGGLTNGTLDWGAALDELLAGLLSSPAGNNVADVVSDLLSQLGEWLNTPLGGGDDSSAGGDDDSGDDKPAGGAEGDDNEDPSDGLDLGLGSLLDDILGAIGLGGDDDGTDGTDGGGLGDAASGIIDTITGLLSGLTGGGGGGGAGANPNGTAPGDLLNQLVASLTGGADSPLAGIDLANLVPVLSAVVRDDAARAQLPSLLALLTSKGGQAPDLAALGPVLAAITSDPEAAKQLPTLLALLPKLGINLG